MDQVIRKKEITQKTWSIISWDMHLALDAI